MRLLALGCRSAAAVALRRLPGAAELSLDREREKKRGLGRGRPMCIGLPTFQARPGVRVSLADYHPLSRRGLMARGYRTTACLRRTRRLADPDPNPNPNPYPYPYPYPLTPLHQPGTRLQVASSEYNQRKKGLHAQLQSQIASLAERRPARYEMRMQSMQALEAVHPKLI